MVASASDPDDNEIGHHFYPSETFSELQRSLIANLDNANVEHLRRSLTQRHSQSEETSDEQVQKDQKVLRQFNDDFELENWIRTMLRTLDRSGIKLRNTGVEFKNLTVTGVNAGVSYQETFWSFLTTPFRIKEIYRSLKNPPIREIIHDFNGLVRNGEMLLVLGRPGSGCSTFLKAIAGNHLEYKAIKGNVNFNGISQKKMLKYFKGEVSYCQEVDVHFPTLTVGQTLEFVAKTRTPQKRPNNISRKDYIEIIRDLFCTTLGLRHTLNTKVGNDYVRGVSGGERKRVSIAENFITRSTVQCWDNSTRGLDASTALEYTRALRISTNLASTTCLVAIYQAGENIYDLFDKTTVLYDGHQIYFGPANKARDYFITMGYEPAPRQTTADYLTAITDPLARETKKGFEDKAPRTPQEFEEYWKKSPEYDALMKEMSQYENKFPAIEEDPAQIQNFFEGAKQEKSRHVKYKSPYTISYQMQIRYCIERAYQRMLGNLAYHGANAFAAVFQSLIIGSIFYDLPDDTSGFFSRGGVIFFAVLYTALSALAEITNMYEQRPIIAKHKNYAMYHASADAISLIFADIPIKFLIVVAFDLILYFLTGLQRSADQFFIFFLFTFTVTIAMTSFFRLLATLTKNVSQALALGGIGVLILSVYTGYVIPTRDTGWWFRWLSYVNPVQFCFEALMVNEFKTLNVRCSAIVPSGGSYDALPIANKVCAVTGSVAGSDIVNGLDYLDASFGYKLIHLWRNYAILIGFLAFFIAGNLIGSEFIEPTKNKGEVLVFQRGKAPKSIEKALDQNKPVDLEESNIENPGTELNDQNEKEKNKLEGLVKPKDIFTWRHVTLDISIKSEKRRLLNDVQGYVKPGTITALMGESGAGKTTLLNALAQRIDIGVLTGDMLVNGKPMGKSFQRSTGYVQQQDVHKTTSTVREALLFSAFLRQPTSVSRKEKEDYVETVIQLLDMHDFANAVVGEPGEGLNVEQRKRLTIGVELAAKPTLLLFLDEPTSGLDSQSAWSIVLFLKKLASAGQAILCTIHQPSSELFHQFDRLLLLKKGGQTVYFGEIGSKSSTLLKYFEDNGSRKCDESENPAEAILEFIGAGATASVKEDWAEIWRKSPQYKEVCKEIDDIHKSMEGEDMKIIGTTESSYAIPLRQQIYYCTVREFQAYWRNINVIKAKLFLNIIAGLFLGFTFYKANNSVQGLQNKLFSVFMAVVLSVTLIQQLQPRFFDARALFEVRERPSKMYSWPAFLMAQIIVEIPYHLVFGTIFFLEWYFLVGFFRSVPNHSFVGILTWLYFVVFNLYFVTFGLAIAAASPNEQVASVIVTLLFTFVLTFSGVLQPISMLVGFWKFAYYSDPYTYLIGGILSIILHDVKVTCKNYEYNIIEPPNGQTCAQYLGPFLQATNTYVDNPNAVSGCKFCRFSLGDDYLKTINLSFAYKWRNFGIVWGYIFFNASMIFVFFYIFREKPIFAKLKNAVVSVFTSIKRKKGSSASSEPENESNSSENTQI